MDHPLMRCNQGRRMPKTAPSASRQRLASLVKRRPAVDGRQSCRAPTALTPAPLHRERSGKARQVTAVVFGGEPTVWLGPFCLVGVVGGFGHPELAGVGEVVGHLPQFDVQLLG